MADQTTESTQSQDNLMETSKTMNVESNTDELVIDEISNEVPMLDFKKIEYVHSLMAERIIEGAHEKISFMESQLGPEQNNPTMKGLQKMFKATFEIHDKHLKKPKNKLSELTDYIPVLKEIQQNSPTVMQDLLKAKFSYEQSSHKNNANLMRSSINVGAGIATARVNWDFAVEIYKETKQNASAVFREAVYTAYMNELDQTETRNSKLANKILSHQTSFNYAVNIAKAIDAYGKEIEKANSSLFSAYNTLSSELIKQWNVMVKGETTFIIDNRSDSLSLWTSIRAAYDKLFTGKRKI